MSQSDYVRIAFDLDPKDWHRVPVETLWAKPLSLSSNEAVLVLQNSPFFVKDVSYLDVVKGVKASDASVYNYAGIIDRAGHSTYRMLVKLDDLELRKDIFERFWKKLELLGCTYENGEHGGQMLFTMDVPALTNADAVYRILEEGEANNIWTFQEGHCGHPL